MTWRNHASATDEQAEAAASLWLVEFSDRALAYRRAANTKRGASKAAKCGQQFAWALRGAAFQDAHLTRDSRDYAIMAAITRLRKDGSRDMARHAQLTGRAWHGQSRS